VVQWMRHSNRRFHCERSTIWTKMKGDKSKLLFKSLSTTRQASVFHCEATCTAIIYCSYNSLIPQVVTIISELQASPGRKFDCRYDSLCRSGSFYYRVEAVATFLCLERNELWIPISDRILIFDTGREGRYYSGPYFCADFEKTGIVHSTGSFDLSKYSS